ncbi:MAG: hypothetical protein JNL82_36420 [Myxococcales bacterium]|nr:hypothetical protein [Myxococcales bacterium]
MAAGHIYRIGKDWYADTALLQRAARRHVVEPMQGAYQILAPGGLVRCVPTQGLALPGQIGDLYRCQGQRAGQDIGLVLRDLAQGLGPGTIGGEWDAWPASASATSHGCGCTACKVGGSCRADSAPNHAPPVAERLVASETLGTVITRVHGEQIAVYKAEHGAPEWACGRYHECIGSILQFPDLQADERIARVTFQPPRTVITWDVVLDRQRRLMLKEILELVGRQLAIVDHEGAVRPSRPPMMTPGHGAWELAALSAEDDGTCSVCPYRLGTNLRCKACRRACLGRKVAPVVDQARRLADMFAEREELRRVPRTTLRTLAATVATSHNQNPHAPLTDAFFVRLERDVLAAAGPLALSGPALLAAIEIAEQTPLHPDITVGAAARRAA